MRQSGFTLLELLVALALLVIGVTALATGFSTLLAQHQMSTGANGVLGMIHLARSEGMARNGVYLCDGDRGCHQSGWTGSLVLMTTDTPDALLLQHFRLPDNTQVKWNGFRGHSLHYGARGHSIFQNGHFLICHTTRTSLPARKIVVNWIGRPRVEKTTTADCSP